jgi:sarcosine oxidase subunit gamma
MNPDERTKDPLPRLSSLHELIGTAAPPLRAMAGMPVAMQVSDEHSLALNVGVADLSVLVRVGVKGPHAAAWLSRQGLTVPETVNTWLRQTDGAIVARLGRSEFFVEDGGLEAGSASRLAPVLATGEPGLYPVPRQDVALALVGTRALQLLRQTCSVDFQEFLPSQQTAVMTQMAGVSVLVLWHAHQDATCYRIWCDPTYGHYLFATLVEIARELGGGFIGTQGFLGLIRA